MPLTDTAIRKAKPADKPQRLPDGGGLYLELSPAGGKWWRLKYRFDGKEKRISLGTYPDTSLASARDKRDAARKLLAAGVDPGEHRKAEKAAGDDRAANSFEVVARPPFRESRPSHTVRKTPKTRLTAGFLLLIATSCPVATYPPWGTRYPHGISIMVHIGTIANQCVELSMPANRHNINFRTQYCPSTSRLLIAPLQASSPSRQRH